MSISRLLVRYYIAETDTLKETHMRTCIALIAAMADSITAADVKSERSGPAAAFAQLKTLVGEWEGSSPTLGKLKLQYELTAAGTALVERETAEKMPPMLTVYHLDGDRLLLTHYCAAGNQPRMQARAFDAESKQLEFQFMDATNLTSHGAGHMHSVRMRFIDKNRFAAEWDFYENGQRKSTETAEYTRVR